MLIVPDNTTGFVHVVILCTLNDVTPINTLKLKLRFTNEIWSGQVCVSVGRISL